MAPKSGLAQESAFFVQGFLSTEIGIYKPYSIDANPSKPFKNVQGAKPFAGIAFQSPMWKSTAFRVTIFQWQQENVIKNNSLETVTLRHLSCDLKNYIINQYRISPFTTYGLALIWSREAPTISTGQKVPLDRAGYGVNVGAGVDFQIATHWGFSAEYQYLYAKFEKVVGLTDNYSGPKLSFKIVYIF